MLVLSGNSNTGVVAMDNGRAMRAHGSEVTKVKNLRDGGCGYHRRLMAKRVSGNYKRTSGISPINTITRIFGNFCIIISINTLGIFFI